MDQAAQEVSGTKMLAFRADAEMVRALEEAARRNDRSLSGEIRQALRAYLLLQGEEVAA